MTFEVGTTYLGFGERLNFHVRFKCIKVTEEKVTFKVKGVWDDAKVTYQTTIPILSTANRYCKKAFDKRIGLMVDSTCVLAE